jgi:hypothetical protein
MAFSVHSSGRRHNIPVTTQTKQANASTAILSGYTSKLVSVTPMMVTMLAIHPISLTCFSNNFNLIPKDKLSKRLLLLC